MYRFLSQPIFGTFTSLSLIAATVHAAEPVDYELQPVSVTSSAYWLAPDDSAQPVAVLAPEGAGTSSQLGDALGHLPGVHASAFGAGASRPIIRAFSGERVRVLADGLDVMDVSAASPDHAVPLDAGAADRVEILRGPATLRYGSTAVGGVVNVRSPWADDLASVPPGFSLATDASTVDDGKVVRLDGQTPLAGLGVARVQLGWEEAHDYDIPGTAESKAFHAAEVAEALAEDPDAELENPIAGYVANSWSRARTLNLEHAYAWSSGARLEWGFSTQDHAYGVPGHEHHHEEDHDPNAPHDDHEEEGGVHIEMDQQRFTSRLEIPEPLPFLANLQVALAYGDYAHEEIEGEEVGTRFERTSWELRVQARHTAMGPLQGEWGYHGQFDDFGLSGEEAYTPSVEERRHGVYVIESFQWEQWTLTGGARVESVSLDPESTAPRREENPVNANLALTYHLNEAWSLSGQYAYLQRSPNREELYADGPHLATRQYLIGDLSLPLEQGYLVEATLRYHQGPLNLEATVFHQGYDDYLAELPTGAQIEEVDVFQYSAVEATFTGGELQASWTFGQTPETAASLTARFDYVDARDETHDAPLPRTPPMRAGLGWSQRWHAWHAAIDWLHAWQQEDLAEHELISDSYDQVRLHLARDFTWRASVLTLQVRVENLLDEEIRLHTSALKDQAPLPGRNLQIGAILRY